MTAPGGHRRAARLAAVQALYEMELAGADADPVLQDFLRNRWRAAGENAQLPVADEGLLSDLIMGIPGRLGEIDAKLGEALPPEWPVERLEPLLRAVMRAGAFELLAMPDVPARVAISEYVEVAAAFYDAREAGMANAVLDRMARTLRPGEMAEDGRDGRSEQGE